ncbi:MAG: thioesterase family protein [Bacteroidota bacterium]
MPTVLHTSHVPVRWGDMDAFAHVNNATYLTYAEHARIDWLASVYPEGEADTETGPILASISADFKRPVQYPATVEVQVTAGDVGRTSLRQGYVLSVDGKVVCEVEAVLVWVSRVTGRPVPLPDAVRAGAGG